MNVLFCFFIFYSASDRIKVMVLFPADGVSAIQRTQMTAMEGENIHVVGKWKFDYFNVFCHFNPFKAFSTPNRYEYH